MSDDILGRHSREELGLPPPAKKPARFVAAARALLLAAILIGIGYAAGLAAKRWRAITLDAAIADGAATGSMPAAIANSRSLALALRDDPAVRLRLAAMCMAAARESRRQNGYLANASNLLENLGPELADTPFLSYQAERLYAACRAEFDDYDTAENALLRAGKALREIGDQRRLAGETLTLNNDFAYFLAVDPASGRKDVEKALELAKTIVSSKEEISPGRYASDTAAFVDTLAAAWFAVGDCRKALDTQFLALGLAESADLDVYLKHYDTYAKSSSRATVELGVLSAEKTTAGKRAQSVEMTAF